jgi:hypothetical protein
MAAEECCRRTPLFLILVALGACGPMALGSRTSTPVDSLWGDGQVSEYARGRLASISVLLDQRLGRTGKESQATRELRAPPLPGNQNSSGTIHNVLDYGAVGDGQQDDTAAFQRTVSQVLTLFAPLSLPE